MWFRDGMIAKAAGDRAAARASLTRALAINPRFDRNDEARAALAELERRR
jgi:Tfp pilus assembly protein PilF